MPSFHATVFGEIERRRRQSIADAERVAAGCVDDAGELSGGVDQRLRRDAAADQAGAAEPVAFDQHGVEAELAGADRRDIAARPAADHQHLGCECSGIISSIEEHRAGVRAGA